jgi:hypothetical protein
MSRILLQHNIDNLDRALEHTKLSAYFRTLGNLELLAFAIAYFCRVSIPRIHVITPQLTGMVAGQRRLP